jgi:hypothetical protein
MVKRRSAQRSQRRLAWRMFEICDRLFGRPTRKNVNSINTRMHRRRPLNSSGGFAISDNVRLFGSGDPVPLPSWVDGCPDQPDPIQIFVCVLILRVRRDLSLGSKRSLRDRRTRSHHVELTAIDGSLRPNRKNGCKSMTLLCSFRSRSNAAKSKAAVSSIV